MPSTSFTYYQKKFVFDHPQQRALHEFYDKFKALGRNNFSVDMRCRDKGASRDHAPKVYRRCRRINKNLVSHLKAWDQARAELKLLPERTHPTLLSCVDEFEDYQYFYLLFEDYLRRDFFQGLSLFTTGILVCNNDSWCRGEDQVYERTGQM